VYDSGSTDATVEIARAAGAHVSIRQLGPSTLSFGGDEAEHRNWALKNIRFRHPWVFSIDADERMTKALVENITKGVRNPGGHVAFRVRCRYFFQGRWLKHVQATPFYLRLFRPEKMHYSRLVNPRLVSDGPVGELDGYFDHFPFSKGMQHWFDKHNSYSTLEARQIAENRQLHGSFSVFSAFFAKEFHERRFHQKELFYRLPCRPFVKFALLYVAKRGFLDGRAGFTYAVLQSLYEYMIVLKTRELAAAKAAAERPSG